MGMVGSEESRRYISGGIHYWLPDAVHAKPEGSIKQGSGTIHEDSDCMLAMMKSQTETSIASYEYLLDRGVAPEEARMVLPLNHMVNFSWTGSLVALLRVVKQRQDSHAQLAAQEFANKLKPILLEHFPHASQAYLKYM